ncbi:hypothetical protein [Paenarthrobacter sp. NPDC057981]|uniref:hypothetical protein n=1 Tax=Paenarthrobacter sp. NPDC057981 TaxID=3346297 RepID=UPI0036D80594
MEVFSSESEQAIQRTRPVQDRCDITEPGRVQVIALALPAHVTYLDLQLARMWRQRLDGFDGDVLIGSAVQAPEGAHVLRQSRKAWATNSLHGISEESAGLAGQRPVSGTKVSSRYKDTTTKAT